MPMSVRMQAVYEEAKRLDGTFSAEQYRDLVVVAHEDGTTLYFDNAFEMLYFDKDHMDKGRPTYAGQWLMVFTEHVGFHVFHLNDLRFYRQFRRVPTQRHESFIGDQFICESCTGTFVAPGTDSATGELFCPWCGLDPVREMTKEEKEEEAKAKRGYEREYLLEQLRQFQLEIEQLESLGFTEPESGNHAANS